MLRPVGAAVVVSNGVGDEVGIKVGAVVVVGNTVGDEVGGLGAGQAAHPAQSQL